jgi:Tol biopolymer transport system component
VSDGSYDIWTKDLAGGAPRPLIVGPGVDDGPEYSPDGRHLYFNSTRSGAMALWRAQADGSGPVQITHDPARRDWFPHLSPDGKWIAYVSFGDDIALADHPPNRTDVQIRLMAADGSDPVMLTHDPARRDWFPHLSPDGKWIVYVSFGDDVALEDHPPNREDVQLRIIPADGSAPPQVLTRLFGGQGTINVPSWSPDGRQLAFVSYRLKR